jgi:hypothetical protein
MLVVPLLVISASFSLTPRLLVPVQSQSIKKKRNNTFQYMEEGGWPAASGHSIELCHLGRSNYVVCSM